MNMYKLNKMRQCFVMFVVPVPTKIELPIQVREHPQEYGYVDPRVYYAPGSMYYTLNLEYLVCVLWVLDETIHFKIEFQSPEIPRGMYLFGTGVYTIRSILYPALCIRSGAHIDILLRGTHDNQDTDTSYLERNISRDARAQMKRIIDCLLDWDTRCIEEGAPVCSQ